MAKTRIRQAVRADFPTLLNIDKLSFPPGIAYNSAELTYFMKRDGAHTLVAELEGEIAGFILLEIMPRKKIATLVTLDVRQERQRQGLASDLLTSSEEVLNNNEIERYELQVDVQNTGAIAFYEKNGFVKVKQLPNYYANGHDAYLMLKQLG